MTNAVLMPNYEGTRMVPSMIKHTSLICPVCMNKLVTIIPTAYYRTNHYGDPYEGCLSCGFKRLVPGGPTITEKDYFQKRY